MIELKTALKTAEHIAAELSPFCAKLEIAGSIRRQRPWVNDIDLVILPAGPVISDAFKSRLFSNTSLVQDGPTKITVRMRNGTQIDVFIARHETRDLFDVKPTNFGSLLLLRTGSKEHNIYLIEHAKKQGVEWKTHEGIIGPTGTVLASATEKDILNALNLDWIAPEHREK